MAEDKSAGKPTPPKPREEADPRHIISQPTVARRQGKQVKEEKKGKKK